MFATNTRSMKIFYYVIAFILYAGLSNAQIITTIAGSHTSGFSGDGGPATAALFFEPHGVAFDATGNMYISDSRNLRLRKMDPGGVVNTIAGKGALGYGGDGVPATTAPLDLDYGMAFDASGTLFFPDYENNRVRTVNGAGIINTIAGNGGYGYSGDGGPATAAEILRATDNAFDAFGNLYIADYDNGVIRKINTSNIISTIAGTGTKGWSGDGGPATAAKLCSPMFLAFDATGNLYFSDYFQHVVRKIDFASGIITTVAGSTPGLPGYGGDGGPATAARFRGPTGLDFDAAGNLYVCDYDNDRIRRIDGAGTITTFVGSGLGMGGGGVGTGYSGDGGPATTADIALPMGLKIHNGYLYFADAYNNCVRKVCLGPTIASISGPSAVCMGSSISLTDVTPGYSWSSSNTSVATVTSTGLVNGLSAGTCVISYFGADGCAVASATKKITVDITPTVATISGAATVCAGGTISLTDATLGGKWGSSNTSVATITSAGTVSGLVAGTTTISYVLTNACGSAYTTKTVTVNPLPIAGTIVGSSTVCTSMSILLSNSTPGGVWSSGTTAVATITSGGTVYGATIGTSVISFKVTTSCGTATALKTITVITVPSPGTISGPSNVCVGSVINLTDAVAGGSWTASNTNATVSAGVVTGMVSGTDNILYTVSNICGSSSATKTVTINPLPLPIIGSASLCEGSMMALSDGTPGGVWTSSSTIIATISSGGTVSSVSSGTTTISYTLGTGCSAVLLETINPAPPAITGLTTICRAASATLSDAVTGGVWSSSNTTVVTITSVSGIMTGIVPGTSTISYTLSTGCAANRTVKINNCPLSLNDISVSPMTKVYPVPARDYLTIDGVNENATYFIQSISGSLIKEGKLENSQNNIINISFVPPGVYLLEIRADAKSRNIFKIIKY